MPRTAEDIYKVAALKKAQKEYNAYIGLKEKSIKSVTEMMRDGKLVTELDLTSEDMLGLLQVTREMRELNYYYCLIEEQNEEGEILGHRLRISIAHLEKEYGQQNVSEVSLEN